MPPRFDLRYFLEEAGTGRDKLIFKTGTAIFRQGDVADHVFYLLDGRAKETAASDSGKEAIVGVLDPGHFFGTGGMYGARVRVSTVTAMRQCTVTMMTIDAVQQALSQPEFVRVFLGYLVNRNSRIEAEKVDLMLLPAELRLARKLLDLPYIADGPWRRLGADIDQKMLADMIGSTRSRVNHFMMRFRAMGLVRIGHGIQVSSDLIKLVARDEEK